MMVGNVPTEYVDDVEDVKNWCNETYDKEFGGYFGTLRKLYQRMQSSTVPITDEELQEILIDAPLYLFSVSEKISAFRIQLELVKLKIKSKQRDDKSADVFEDTLYVRVNEIVLDRVEREISFSRELIMGAKKIWDSRRRTDAVNPIGEVVPTDPELPDWSPKSSTRGKTYIT